jgi:hypothetical protein
MEFTFKPQSCGIQTWKALKNIYPCNPNPIKRLKNSGRMARGGHGLPKVSLGPSCPTLLCLVGGSTLTGLKVILGVAFPQGWPPAAVFYPLGHPTPYGSDKNHMFNVAGVT